MDIVAISTIMSQAMLNQEASISVMKMAMDTAKVQTSDLANMMEKPVNPHIGSNLDIKL